MSDMSLSPKSFLIVAVFAAYTASQSPTWGQQASHFSTKEIVAAARTAIKEGRDRTAVNLFLTAAKTGNAEAQSELSKLYAGGFGTERNLREAKRWALLAARQGVLEAQNLVGLISLSFDPELRDLPAALNWFQMATAGGFANAQFNLGQLYLDGHGVAKDPELGLSLVEEAAKKGDSAAQLRTSRIYHKGHIVPRNAEHAIYYAKLAARGGQLEAAVMLSIAYANGHDVEKDVEESRKWIRIGTRGQNPENLFKLAAQYSRTPDGKLRRHPIAVTLLTEAAKHNHLPSIKALARISILRPGNKTDLTRAVALYEKAVKLGDLELTHDYAMMHLDRTIIPRNFEKGTKLLNVAAKAGYAKSQARLGALYYKDGRPDAIKQAELWLTSAADQGDAEGRYWLASLYYLEGRQGKLQTAIRLLQLAVQQGFVPAISRLGRFRFHGHPIPQDVKLGLRMLHSAAIAGDANAQFELGNAFFYGTHVKQDYPNAALWMQRAAAQNHPDAVYMMSRIYQNGFGVPKNSKRAKKMGFEALELGSIDMLFPIAKTAAESGSRRGLIEAIAMYSVIEKYMGRKENIGLQAHRARTALEGQLSAAERSRAAEQKESLYSMIKSLRTPFD